jgi:cytochrome c oxidase subunit I
MTTIDPTASEALPSASEEAEPKGNHLPGLSRICETTGFTVDLTAEKFIKLHAVVAVVFLLLGGIAALLIALTRWPAVHLLPAEWYYRLVTFHGLNMLILWILFFEIAVLYFAATVLLKTRLASAKLAWVGFALMLAGAVLIDVMVLSGQADVMFTAYAPLRANQLHYLGIILFAVGALVGVINFFATVYIAKRDKTYKGSVPLVVFGAITAAIIAVVTLLHGAATFIPTWLWAIGVLPSVDPAMYRLLFWGLGHQSQQVNVAAMVSIWYLMSALTVGGKVLNQAVSRTAFLLYILFINLASAHHLLVDPGVSAGWKIWNTSYAMYLAVLASMIHGYTVPASVEVALRKQGHNKGLFGWLGAAPWRNPGFSGFFLSLVIFGFIGGITGVTLGTEQINIIAHNTLRIPGHFHATVVGGTSLAFMAVSYYVVPLIFRREYPARALCRLQPYVFALGVVMISFGMSFAGSYGVARRHWDVEFTGAAHPAAFDPSVHVWLGMVGIGGVVAFTGLILYVGLTVAAVFFGKKVEGKILSW